MRSCFFCYMCSLAPMATCMAVQAASKPTVGERDRGKADQAEQASAVGGAGEGTEDGEGSDTEESPQKKAKKQLPAAHGLVRAAVQGGLAKASSRFDRTGRYTHTHSCSKGESRWPQMPHSAPPELRAKHTAAHREYRSAKQIFELNPCDRHAQRVQNLLRDAWARVKREEIAELNDVEECLDDLIISATKARVKVVGIRDAKASTAE